MTGGVEVECQGCGYEWAYSGEMYFATCPNCSRKTITPRHPEYTDEEGEVDQ